MPHASRYKTFDRPPWESRLLTRDEERGLALAIRHGTEAEAREARATFAACNLRWCRELAARAAAKWFADSDDCFGAAQLGLLRAIDKFDPDRGFRFTTMATMEIVSAIQRFALPYIHAVSTPTWMTKGGKRNSEHIAAAASWGSCLSLDHGYDGSPFSADVPDLRDDVAALDEAEESCATLSALDDAMRTLAPKERAVIRLRFPLDGSAAVCRKKVGREIGSTAEWVKQIEEAALVKLRAFLESRRASA